MRGDFSRLVPDLTDYSLVLMQQGRVLVESDWNAAMSGLIGAQRTLAADLIGPHGGPGPEPGFLVTRTDGGDDLTLAKGVYYVDGIRCQLSDELLWSEQPYLGPSELPEAPFLVYLDVWERHVSTIEDDSIREVALGGADTTSRRQVIWQVRAAEWTDDDTPTCGDFDLDDWRRNLRGHPPQLRARTGPPPSADNPCLASPDARYRGVENQLYRVEIVSVATDDEEDSVTSFVWSRENGSVAAPWTATVGNRLHVAGVRDSRRGFAANDWVELTWDALEFAGVAGTRVQLTSVDGGVLTFDPATRSGDVETDPLSLASAKVRRWDQRGRTGAPLLDGGAVEVVEGSDEQGWIPLEDGIQVQFATSDNGGHDYRVGDYWTIPARVATGDIIWPQESMDTARALPPHGVEHHYAPLAWFGADGSNVVLQKVFSPLGECMSD